MSRSNPRFRRPATAFVTARRLVPIRRAISTELVRTVPPCFVSRHSTSHVRASARDKSINEQSTNELSSRNRFDVVSVRFDFSALLLFAVAGRGFIGGNTEQPGNRGGCPWFISWPPNRQRLRGPLEFWPTVRQLPIGACPVARRSMSRCRRRSA